MGYWEDRQAQQMYQAMNDAEQASQEIADIYAKASREINYEIQKIYERYRDKFNLSDEEAKKLLNTMRNPTDIDELIQRLKETKGPAAQEILKELESPAYRARIERLQNLQQEIDRVMRDVYNQEKKVSTTHYINQYCNAYYQEIYNIQRRAGFQFSFSAVDPKELHRILSMSWTGANYSQRIWKNTEALAKDLKEQLILGYLTGKPLGEIASEIANKYSTGAYNARRLVRTEAAFMYNQGHMTAYDECGIDKYRIMATLDLRTSEKCRGMDGKVYEKRKAVVGVNMPPFHPFCRTITLAVLDDENLAELTRIARDPVTGKNVKVPADTTYEQWYKKNVTNNPKAQAAEKMSKNRASDQRQFERYKNVIGSSASGKRFDKFQDLKYNEPKEFAKMQRNYKTFKAIDGKTWSDEFKTKAKETYKKFRKHDIEMSDHALARFLDRSKKAGTPMTVQSLAEQHKKPVNFYDGEKSIRFYDEIAMVSNTETGEIVSLVRRKNAKKDWEVADDE